MSARRFLHLALALPLAIAGCREKDVESYRVPKEKDPELPSAAAAAAPEAPSPQPSAPSGNPMAGTAVPVAAGPGLAWTAPAGWKTKAAGAMRKGSYGVPGDGGGEADLSITAFPGDVGGELANVNRWRGQLGLPPLAESGLPGDVSRLEHDGLKFTVVDFAGQSQRIVGAIVPYSGGTWFFKLMGPDPLVAKEKPAFLAFLQTVKPAAP